MPSMRVPVGEIDRLVDAITEAEQDHQQVMDWRGELQYAPIGCRCGIEYDRATAWHDSQAHLRHVQARAALEALYRPCAACEGQGVQTKRFTTCASICVDCEGTGRLTTPLPPYQFRDWSGLVWHADMDEHCGVPHQVVVRPLTRV